MDIKKRNSTFWKLRRSSENCNVDKKMTNANNNLDQKNVSTRLFARNVTAIFHGMRRCHWLDSGLTTTTSVLKGP